MSRDTYYLRHLLAVSVLGMAAPVWAQPATDAAPLVVETPALPPAPDIPLNEILDPSGVDPQAPVQPQRSPNVTVNLINSLVQKGILSQAEARALIQQAEADAEIASAQLQAAAIPVPNESDVRVTYVPEVVRNQMRDQIQQELMAQAREEKWGKSDVPDWASKIRPFGDFRARYEGIFFDDTNNPNFLFTNFNAINTGSPFNYGLENNNFDPLYNVDQDRERGRIRARGGADILLGEGFNGGFRIATGESNSPTSPNQTLGGSGGNFSKYSIWLDRAFLSYDAGPGDGEELTFFLGRFDNPFFSSEIQWDDDLGFDGIALRGKVHLTDAVSTFFTAGYFPIFNTDFNFASNQPGKFESTDKWLTGAQIGIDWKIQDDLTAKVAVAYYDFDAIEGKLSSPFTPLSANDSGDSDSTRFGFSQGGNTKMPLRNIDNTTAANDFGNEKQFQYFGLASEFRNVTLTGRLDYQHFDPLRLSLLGEVTKNVGFDESEVAERAYSNGRAGRTLANSPDDFEGGDMAWYLAFQIGKPAMEKLGDWQASLGYRYVESDAVVDGFTDSDFGGGGTNLQGLTLGGSLALSRSVRAGLRWMDSDEIDGPPRKSDTLQFDVNAKF